MRLSSPDVAPGVAEATIRAAREAGIVRFDTARAYGPDADGAGHNEQLVARVLAETGPGTEIVTKCGMRREAAAWIPDGRAATILDDARASFDALGGRPLDLLLLHAPDPGRSILTSARALGVAVERGLARRVGVSNVSRAQLDEAARAAPIGAVQVALGAHDDAALRGGVVAACVARGFDVLAHSPFGGPERAAKLSRDSVLVDVAAEHDDAGPLDVLLAYLLAASPAIAPVVGARRPATVARIVAAARLLLGEDQLTRLDARFPALGALRRPVARPVVHAASAEVVVMMGVPGAGKSRAAIARVAEGYERLNRDTLGGTLRGIAKRLDASLARGVTRIVLDNTYVDRASRNDVVRVAHAHGAVVRCVWFDTKLADAQLNVVGRMLEHFGRVLSPEELSVLARKEPAAIPPNALFRMIRALEPPADDEGFASIERVTFEREHSYDATRPGLAIALGALDPEARAFVPTPAAIEVIGRAPADAACLIFGWLPGSDDTMQARAGAFAASLAEATARIVEANVCPHPPGPPICWCRPPLPGLWLAFARAHGVDARASSMLAASAADRTMARALEMRVREDEPAPRE